MTKETELFALFDEATRLFHGLKALAEQVHSQGVNSAGRRGVLRSLAEGPATVPHLAKSRPVSRQHMQTVVNALYADGLVEFVENPAHQRSKLVKLTAAGRRELAAIGKREQKAIRDIDLGVTEADLARAKTTLAKLNRKVKSLLQQPE